MQSAFFLDSDDDGHWYVVKLAHADEWNAWCALPREDENSWVVPDYAEAIGGAPSNVIFTDYETF